MKNAKKIGSLVFLAMFFLTGCLELGFQDRLMGVRESMPQKPDLTIATFWRFTDVKSLVPNQAVDKPDYYDGLGAYFTKNLIKVGQDTVKEPEIKAMNIRTYDFFLTKYKMSPQEVGITDEMIPMLTVSDSKGFASRFFLLSNGKLAMERNRVLVFFEKVDSLQDTGISRIESVGEDQAKKEMANGVLIGLRENRQIVDAHIGPAKYRTIWIAMNKEGQLSIYEFPNLIFPRDTFYQLSVNRQENSQRVVESVEIENLESGEKVVETGPSGNLTSRYHNITFVSNDYFSLETRLSPDVLTGPFQFASTRNVDRPNESDKVSIMDLFGPEGESVMRTSFENSRVHNISPGISNLEADYNPTSFLLKRRNGRWTYEGRINNKLDSDELYNPYQMMFQDNFHVYRYDNLKPNWSDLTRRIANPIDAISSPGNFFTVVQTKGHLNLYQRTGETITEEPMVKIPTNDEVIVMHEWARGSYVEKWTKIAEKYGRKLK